MWRNLVLKFFIVQVFVVNLDAKSTCGAAGSTTGFVVNGTKSDQGQWPWLVGLFLFEKHSFFCGGTLISENMIITAAHCIQNKQESDPKRPNQIFASLGRYDISKTFEPDSDAVQVSKIHIHPEWNPFETKYDADIAILTLDHKVRMTKTIFPICLPDIDDEMVDSVKKGIVVGWGKSSKSSNYENTPRQTELNVVKNDKCFLSDSRLTVLSSERTFCGGSDQSSGPCTGDSGGAFAVKIGELYYHRGVVSAGIYDQLNDICNVQTMQVYTDTLEFLSWINKIVSESGDTLPKPETSTPNKKKEIFCFFESWAEGRSGNGAYSIYDMEPDLCTKAVFLHAELDGDAIKSINPQQQLADNGGRNLFKRFNDLKKSHPDFKTLLAIGSWNEGSEVYSKLAASPRRRKRFARFTADYIERYNFDGIHLHWEYPGHRGGSPDDKQNLNLLLKDLSDVFKPRGLYLSVLVRSERETVAYSYDIKTISKYADAICFYSMDFTGFWDNKIGFHAGIEGEGQSSVRERVEFMTTQGAPSSKLLMSIPFYGRGFLTSLSGNIGDSAEGGFPGIFSGETGFVGYSEICEYKKKSTWTQRYDRTSNQIIGKFTENGKNYVITYDSPRTVANKIKLMMANNLGGVWVWFVSTDDFRGDCEPDLTTFSDYKIATKPPRSDRDYPLLRTINEAIDILSN